MRQTDPGLRPGSRLQPAVAVFLLILFSTSSCTVRKDFNKTVSEDSIQSYEQFLENYPEEKGYSKQARTRLEALVYEDAVKRDTFEAYAAFFRRFPYSQRSQEAEHRAEDVRARDLGIHLYRQDPPDYHQLVNRRDLPYRLLVKCSEPEGETSKHLERIWYEELARRDLFVPLDPGKSYPVLPDISLYVRESVVRLLSYPYKYIEARAVVHDQVRVYRIVAENPERFLLYEVFRDRPFYESVLQVPAEEKRRAQDSFKRFCQRLPLPGSMAFEYEIRQHPYEWDQELVLAYTAFLKSLGLFKDLAIFQRGQPPDSPYARSVHFRVDPDTHAPSIRKQGEHASPSGPWSSWNSKWILSDPDYFFKRMTLDLLG